MSPSASGDERSARGSGNLDSRSTAEVLDIFARLHAEGRTVVMITHEDDVAAHAQRTIRMADGRIVEPALV
jgi:putative ABC transport system ATP-binding protein